MKELKILWDAIPNKTSRVIEYVLERHAFFTACRHAGYSTVELARLSGFDHSTVSHATKMHSSNLLDKAYRKHYEFYKSFYSIKDEKKRLQNQIGILQKRLNDITEQEAIQNRFISLQSSLN